MYYFPVVLTAPSISLAYMLKHMTKTCMKSKLLILFVLAMSACSAGMAQGFHLGLKGGANLYKIQGKSFKEEFSYGYNAGVFAEINFDKHWGIQPELLWNQSQTRTTNDFNSIYHTSASDLVDVKLNYLSIPLLASYRPAKFIAFQAGPQFGILLNRDQDLYHNGQSAFKYGEVSLLGGVQFNIGGLKLGGRYSIGITNINNSDNNEAWRNHGFQLYAGFRII